MIRTLLFTLALGVFPHLLRAAPPTLYLIGDSTVKNGSGKGADGLWGWGQVLGEHFDEAKLKVENRALGGRSSRTYLTEGLWQRVRSTLKPGDFVLMQFGHNDGGELFATDRPRASLKGTGEEAVIGVVTQTGKAEQVQTFGWYLRKYITDAQAAGATPIVLSPVPRNMWRGDRVLLAQYDYGLWAREAARQTGVAFVDLNGIIAQRYEREGEPKVMEQYFTAADHTHTTEAGARVNAECVIAGLRNVPGDPFGALFREQKPLPTPKFPLRIPVAAEESPYDAERGYGLELSGVQARRLSITAPEGNYDVKVSFDSAASASHATIKSELYRLQVERRELAVGEPAVCEFRVNVRTPQLPSGSAVRLKPRERTTEAAAWDNRLTLELLGEPLGKATVEVAPSAAGPTIYLLGDSTVCDQPSVAWAGWGQMLPRFVRNHVAVANHAESGESIASALGARRVEKVLSLVKAGDWVLIQFGHNDMKNTKPDAVSRYAADLRSTAQKLRERGAQVAFVTSMERMSGVKENTLAEYPETMIRVANEIGVAVFDLHARSQELYAALGADLPHAFQDGTHHTTYGAYLLAQCVVGEIERNAPGLANLLDPAAPRLDPAQPRPFADWRLPN